MADQAAAGEQPGSPWLDAAAGLRALAGLLRGVEPDLSRQAPLYRTLLERIRPEADFEQREEPPDAS